MTADASISSIRAVGSSTSPGSGRGQRVGDALETTANVTSASAPSGTEQKPELPELVSRLNDAFQMSKRALQFHVDTDSGRTVITVIDQETEEIIRQIPPEELLAIVNQLDHGRGLIVRGRA